jgi:hypothetical protein
MSTHAPAPAAKLVGAAPRAITWAVEQMRKASE